MFTARMIGMWFSSHTETDINNYIITFSKGIDYVSYVCLPREDVVMTLTSETGVK